MSYTVYVKADPFTVHQLQAVRATNLQILQENKTCQRTIPWLSCYAGDFTCKHVFPLASSKSLKFYKVFFNAVSQLPCADAKGREEKPRKCSNWFINAPKCEQAWWSVKRDVTPVWQSCHSGKDIL